MIMNMNTVSNNGVSFNTKLWEERVAIFLRIRLLYYPFHFSSNVILEGSFNQYRNIFTFIK